MHSELTSHRFAIAHAGTALSCGTGDIVIQIIPTNIEMYRIGANGDICKSEFTVIGHCIERAREQTNPPLHLHFAIIYLFFIYTFRVSSLSGNDSDTIHTHRHSDRHRWSSRSNGQVINMNFLFRHGRGERE